LVFLGWFSETCGLCTTTSCSSFFNETAASQLYEEEPVVAIMRAFLLNHMKTAYFMIVSVISVGYGDVVLSGSPTFAVIFLMLLLPMLALTGKVSQDCLDLLTFLMRLILCVTFCENVIKCCKK
jgi:hypothetical protein